jgi:hypothetical protein
MNEADDNLGHDARDDHEFRPELPPPDFDFLVYSLRLQAELNMGLLPYGEDRKPDFDLGRHNIDLLAMLQQKTKGNLSAEEQRSLDNSVTELRFRFVEAKEQHAKNELAKKVDDEQANHLESAPQEDPQPA